MYLQNMLQELNAFWMAKGCLLWQPYHTEVGAGTSNPATFLRVLGPEPWWVAYPEPSIRPDDGRYAENPNRTQHYYQYQVILKPSPPNVQELYLESLEALGLDLTKHDFRFVEDNWQSPSLGAWGLGWEAWLDGMEVLQFTYFQECGGLKLDVRACELTYGVERIAMFLQGADSLFDLQWGPSGVTYGDIYRESEVEYCTYNFEAADVGKLLKQFDMTESEAKRLLAEHLIMPAYDHCLRLSHLFNLLDARGALSVAERGRFLLRCRSVAEGCAKAFFEQRKALGFPLRRLAAPDVAEEHAPAAIDTASYNERDTLLLEIGVEELPHGDVKAVLVQAPGLMEKLLEENHLSHGPISVWVAPRRIAFEVRELSSRQEDVVREVRGPNRAAALDDQGQWKLPAVKFAESQGCTTDDIYFQTQGKAEYCFVKVHQRGRSIAELLTGIVDKLLRAIQFARSMGWEDSSVTFSRPIRWILALHGSKAVPVAWKLRETGDAGPERVLRSAPATYGHRRLAPKPIAVDRAESYRDKLRAGHVLADRDERMQMLRERVTQEADALGLLPEDDEDLFDELCDLVEWPKPVACSIPEESLALPEPIIITPMKVHQRYIPLRDSRGSLSRHFIAVANGEYGEEAVHLIREGNERVLNARLRDAKYFWDNDTRTPLAQFAQGLSRLLFHQKLGTVADKVQRLQTLYPRLREQLPSVDDEKMGQVLTLMKADLTTQMVTEFSSLEGVVGMLYARVEGLPEDIAQAIFEHRLPRKAGDALPSSPLGLVAGLLDRLDTLAGYFSIGIRVKGASDPFGLRRNALALLALVENAGLDVNLSHLVAAAVQNYCELVPEKQQTVAEILRFFADRLEALSRDQGYAYDHIAAVLASHADRPVRAKACLDALKALDDSQVQDLAEQTKRMQRIAKEPSDRVDPSLLAEDEQALFALTREPATRVADWVERKQFEEVFRELLHWTPVINTYFEQVLVNDPEDAVRRNRHALLKTILSAMTAAADVTRIEKREVQEM
jgi:glycyl-tRNA synthetase